MKTITPGILLAATGVGAGDLMTGTLAGLEVGLAILWAVVAGTLLKYALSEGIARWQLATGSTVMEGAATKFGRWVPIFFLFYLTFFTVIVGRALVSACGVAGSAFYPLGDDDTSLFAWAAIHSAIGLALALVGSFAFFERLMTALVGLMFVAVVGAACLVAPDWTAIAAGLVPSVPPEGSHWLLAVLGGVGGTVTLLSYGYWIAEDKRRGIEGVQTCRLDLAVGNGMTALFGMAVIVIGSQVELTAGGSRMALELADQLAEKTFPGARLVFLWGFWGAVFSSLLGVWQSVPYIFADAVDLLRGPNENLRRGRDLRRTGSYRAAVVAIAVVPLFFLGASVQEIQLAFGIFAALFLPLLAGALLVMNNRRRWVGSDFVTPTILNVLLGGALVLFGYLAVDQWWS